MVALKEQIKLFIIQHLACFDTPSEVVIAVKEEFGIELNRSHVALYDPTNHSGRELGVKLKNFFYQKREEFLRNIDLIPISHQSFRLRELEKMYRRAIQKRNDVLAKDVIEQSAKEAGGYYRNKVKVGTEPNDPFFEMLSKFNGGSMPFVEGLEEELITDSEVKGNKQLSRKVNVKWHASK